MAVSSPVPDNEKVAKLLGELLEAVNNIGATQRQGRPQGDRKRICCPCRNGPECKFLKQGECWFSHKPSDSDGAASTATLCNKLQHEQQQEQAAFNTEEQKEQVEQVTCEEKLHELAMSQLDLEQYMGEVVEKHEKQMEALKDNHNKSLDFLNNLLADHRNTEEHNATVEERFEELEKKMLDLVQKRCQELDKMVGDTAEKQEKQIRELKDSHSKNLQSLNDRSAEHSPIEKHKADVEERLKEVEDIISNVCESVDEQAKNWEHMALRWESTLQWAKATAEAAAERKQKETAELELGRAGELRSSRSRATAETRRGDAVPKDL